jgi:bacillolysin
MLNALKACFPLAITLGVSILTAQAPTAPSVSTLAINSRDHLSEFRAWDDRVNALSRTNELVLRSVRPDSLLEGHVHERYDQHFRGIRVFGADIARQVARGVSQSMFGTLYDRIEISVIPTLSEDDARQRFAGLSSRDFPADRSIELVVLPHEDGSYALAWRTHLWTENGWMETFLDAHSGGVILQYNDLRTQAAVGTGTGVLGDQKKVSTSLITGRYIADDRLRPPTLVTFDLGGDLRRLLRIEDGQPFAASDVADDADNVWTDAATVDAHAHLGWTYDYLFKRFGRHGLDGQDGPIQAITHPASRSDLFGWYAIGGDSLVGLYYTNAYWCPGCGPGERGLMVFGDGLPPGVTFGGKAWNYTAGGLDVVAHELTHGLVSYTSRLGPRDEPGALNESFSDMIGTSVEFYYQPVGTARLRADYLIGEDIASPALRSMADPQAFGHPDHYSRRGVGSMAQVHSNAGIPNNAFYLAIEGGVNRTSGIAVQGVGAANREQIERVFFRAFTSLLTSGATFRSARIATIQSASELYGTGSPAERAVTQAWTAVGVN